MISSEVKLTRGRCYCGAVTYEIKGILRDVVNCHCSQCTSLNGNFGSHSKALNKNITITKDEGLRWFNISDMARRGFCKKCGSSLFWVANNQESTGIIAGSLENPTGLKTIGHIFVNEKSDFYEITDDLQQFQGTSNGELSGDFV